MSLKITKLINILLYFFSLCCLQIGVAYSQDIKIMGAEIEWHKYYDNVFIKTSEYIVPKTQKQGDKIILDFTPAKVESFKVINKKSPRIKTVYSIQNKEDVGRIIIELKCPVKHEVASLYGKEEVLVEVSSSQAQVPVLIAEKEAKEPVENKKEEPLNKEGKLSYPSMKRDSLFDIKVASPLKEEKKLRQNILKGKVIVIDPGHGGEDPGASAFDGTKEKDLTLKTSIYLAQYLKDYGATVFLTRKTDVKKTLQDIAAFANKINADAYIGVHFNSLNRPKAGTETYYYTPNSFRLAALVHKRMVLGLKREDRGVRQMMFYTISRTCMPAILVEPVYLTDMQEGILAKSSEFQKEIAKSIALGVKDYFLR